MNSTHEFNSSKQDGGATPEPAGVSLGVAASIAGGLIVLVTLAHLATAWIYDTTDARRAGNDRPAILATEGPGGRSPSLEADPRTALMALRSRKAHALEAYGWVDRQTGVIHIPIERAMQIIAERRLGSREKAPSEEPTP